MQSFCCCAEVHKVHVDLSKSLLCCRSVVGLNVFGLMVTQTLGSVFRAVLLTTRTASVRFRAECGLSGSVSQPKTKMSTVHAACRVPGVSMRHAVSLAYEAALLRCADDSESESHCR